MPHLQFYTDNSCMAFGKPRGLARGLLVGYDSRDITQEGMGIGSVALKTGQFTYFSSASTTESISAGKILKTFLIDSRLILCCGTHPSLLLTWVSEKIVDFYMKYPALQRKTLNLSAPIRRLLHVSFRRESVPALAKAAFTYEINELAVNVVCHLSLHSKRARKVYVLNELGADHFTKSLRDNVLALPPSGWEAMPLSSPAPALYDEKHGIRFFIRDYAWDQKIPLKIYWGREKTPFLCWAGFEFELKAAQAGESILRYAVEFEEKRQP